MIDKKNHFENATNVYNCYTILSYALILIKNHPHDDEHTAVRKRLMLGLPIGGATSDQPLSANPVYAGTPGEWPTKHTVVTAMI